jgi:hypothetical protein
MLNPYDILGPFTFRLPSSPTPTPVRDSVPGELVDTLIIPTYRGPGVSGGPSQVGFWLRLASFDIGVPIEQDNEEDGRGDS